LRLLRGSRRSEEDASMGEVTHGCVHLQGKRGSLLRAAVGCRYSLKLVQFGCFG
jgi:hypothetical protein